MMGSEIITSGYNETNGKHEEMDEFVVETRGNGNDELMDDFVVETNGNDNDKCEDVYDDDDDDVIVDDVNNITHGNIQNDNGVNEKIRSSFVVDDDEKETAKQNEDSVSGSD